MPVAVHAHRVDQKLLDNLFLFLTNSLSPSKQMSVNLPLLRWCCVLLCSVCVCSISEDMPPIFLYLSSFKYLISITRMQIFLICRATDPPFIYHYQKKLEGSQKHLKAERAFRGKGEVMP